MIQPLRPFGAVFLAFAAAGLIGPGQSARAQAEVQRESVVAWPSGPLEVVIALAKPAEPAAVAGLVGRTIPYYQEGITPELEGGPLGALKIAGARVEDEGRTIVLATDPHPRPALYGLDLSGVADVGKVGYTLEGVEVAWTPGADPAAGPAWTAWLPSADLGGFRALAGVSVRHARWAEDLAKPGRLRVDSQALFSPPRGQGEATIASPLPISEETIFGDGAAEGPATKAADGSYRLKFPVADASQPAFLSLTVETGPPAAGVRLSIAGAADGTGPVPFRFLLPWVSTATAGSGREALAIPDLSGGDAAKGEAAFFSKEALCSQCHVVKGKGGAVGPDLTRIARKGAEHVYRSIAVPSEEITPDFVGYTVSLKDGRVASGVVRAEGPDAIRVIDTEAKSTTLRRDEIEEFRPAGTSIMPVGLLPVLGEARLRDIVAYLNATAAE